MLSVYTGSYEFMNRFQNFNQSKTNCLVGTYPCWKKNSSQANLELRDLNFLTRYRAQIDRPHQSKETEAVIPAHFF